MMMRIFAATVLMLLAASCAVAPAFAAAPCAPRAEVLAQLDARFHEKPISIGLTNDGYLLEVLSARDGSTWTVIVSSPQGQTCLVAAGENWKMIPSAEYRQGGSDL